MLTTHTSSPKKLPMKNASRRIFILICFFVMSLCEPLQAQTKATDKTSGPATPADLEWGNLRGAALAPVAPDTGGLSDATTMKNVADRQLTKSRSIADQAKAFYTKNPSHANAGEARKIEAMQLIDAVNLGDTSIEGRMEDAVGAFCRDNRGAESQRAEVAGTYGFSAAMRKRLQGAELYTAYENTARSLMLSYPSQPQGYESLLTIAAGSDEKKGRALTEEILRMPAPASVKVGAQFLLDRLNLVGRPLGDLLTDAGAKTTQTALRSGTPTLIYTWASWSPGSIALGEMLAKRNISQANIIGLNLDEDVVAAGLMAKVHNLPGILHYYNRGLQGALAQRLRVNSAPVVFFIDAKGAVGDVRGMEDIEKKLNAAGL